MRTYICVDSWKRGVIYSSWGHDVLDARAG